MSHWFDPETGAFRLDEIVAGRPTMKRILADGVVTDEELAEQAQRVLGLLHDTEAALNPEQRALVQEMLAELAVLHAVSQYHQMQQASGRCGA